MTRLEKQIADKEKELREMKMFASEKLSFFKKRKPDFDKVLKTYQIKDYKMDNLYVDTSMTGSLILRIYVETPYLKYLTNRQKTNLEKKLRNIVPMPICPITSAYIHIVYYD